MSGREVFLSPHPDDAVWSCGIELLGVAAAGARPLVVTVFDGDAALPGEGWRRVATPALRRAENAAALAQIGADALSLGLVDAALRTVGGAPIYADAQALRGPLATADRALPVVIAARLAAVVHAGDRLHVPAGGAGAHVDHRVVRLAAAGIAAPQRHYPDFPYAPRRHPAAADAVEPWIAAAALYRSQAVGLFGNRAALAAALRAWNGDSDVTAPRR
ncbi:PIG-L deacetylase family protein [Blastochloris viridis]|uniref:GlcNAc-PI de-N-acetylase n=1 Tax=Blastochloris viridis TaxID=1079 RepID=A0A0H5BBV6_BLAVI|nr:PIG-L family deacetylase [Blastochloris viridis]ALK08130.1 2'-N-acetylparomamine deacetylase [Blastochloris viridis]BAR98604.1 hypothetical protein BV133_1011 [Blastochloris viridis]CUU44052.1 hypothetical protein BVIRIDIS_30980 [Blastochloris viridis]